MSFRHLLTALTLASCTSTATQTPTTPVPAGPGGDAAQFDINVGAQARWTAAGSWEAPEGTTSEISVEIGPDATSFYALGFSDNNRRIALTYAEDPTGEVWVDVDLESGSAFADALPLGLDGLHASPNRTIPSGVRVATTLPNSPRLQMTAGTWKLQFGSYNLRGMPVEDTIQVGIFENLRPPDVAPTLDFAVHLTATEANLDLATLSEQPPIQALVSLLDETLSDSGLALGDITYHDASHVEPVVELDATCLRGRPAYDLWTTLDSQEAGAINIVLVDDFRCGNGSVGLAGQAGGIPGLPQSTTDGVFLNTLLLTSQPDLAPRVAVHEIFHFLGLFHTVETGTDLEDSLDDTGPDEDNLMHPTGGDGNSVLTEDQLWVLQRTGWGR